MGAGSPLRRCRPGGAHRQRPWRRGVGREGGRAPSFPVRRVLHARPDGPGRSRSNRTRGRAAGTSMHLLVPGHATLFATRPSSERDRRARRKALGHRGVRALRRVICRRAKETRAAQPVLTCTSGIHSTCTPSPLIFQACRSSSRTSARDCFARRCFSPISARMFTSTRRAPTGGCRTTQGLRSPTSSGTHSASPVRSGSCSARIRHFSHAGGPVRSHDAQVSALRAAGIDDHDCQRVLTGNFDRLFPV